jgi:hypothetical protein
VGTTEITAPPPPVVNENVSVSAHPLDDPRGRSQPVGGRQRRGGGDRAAEVVGAEAVTAGRLILLDHRGDHGHVVLQRACRVARVADEPLVDVLAVVHAHDRAVQ